MKILVLLLLVYGAAAVSRSYKYFETGSSGLPNFPEFMSVGMLDGVVMVHYDSNTRRAEPKQAWMDKVTAGDPDYWEKETQRSMANQQISKVGIEIVKKRFNQTGGFHMTQWMYGCVWDGETGEIDGFNQYAFDGEDFLSLDLKTLTWIAAKAQAVPTKHKWDNDKAYLEYNKKYLTQTCIAGLKELLEAGKSFLLRTERPSVWFLQRTPSSPVSCFATGFYPDRALIFWRKDGEELHEGVETGELLPNHDGTFQISADLTLPEDAKDPHTYECVFQLSGVKEDLVYKLDTHSIKTNHKNSFDATTTIIIVVMVLVLLALASIALILYKKRRAQCPPPASNSDFELRLNPAS